VARSLAPGWFWAPERALAFLERHAAPAPLHPLANPGLHSKS